MSVCQQTWIDGALHFDRAGDLAMLPTREKERRALILAMAEARKSQGSARDGRGGAASSWISGESEDESAEAVDSDTPNQPAPPPQRLLSRMIDAREAFLLGWWRSGRPIESIFSRGDCGCVETAP